ncbi:MAG: type II toxin-antitoxin system HicB family antitoxin [Turneriella sp.]|nr:type II toxin-antitoxin system HicB family antitoxin [Turneriella sp.]
MHYHFKVKKDGKIYWATCVELAGCATQAESLSELRTNMEEALNLYLDEGPESKHVFAMPADKFNGKNIVRVPVAPNIAFALLLRQTRIKHKFTQKQLAERLGMKNIYSYQRLESPKTSNPALSTISKLKKAMPDLHLENIFA